MEICSSSVAGAFVRPEHPVVTFLLPNSRRGVGAQRYPLCESRSQISQPAVPLVRCSQALPEPPLCFVRLQKWHVVKNIVVVCVFEVCYFVWNLKIL